MITFDGSRLLHSGGLVEGESRLALQVIYSRESNLVSRYLNKIKNKFLNEKKNFTIVGTRPEIIKMFPVIIELDKYFKNTLILSGQHYNKNLTDKIFKDLNLRKPDQKIKIVKKENFFLNFQLFLKNN